jgi:hypothetical protein
MNVQEMHYAIDQGLQKVGSFVYSNFLEEELDHVLNLIQDRYIKSSVFSKGGFSLTQRHLDNIREVLVVDSEESFDQDAALNDQSTTLPGDYLFMVNVRAKVSPVDGSGGDQWVPVRIVELDELYKMQANPFAKGKAVSPVASIAKDQVRIFQDGERFILKGSRLDYIRQPEKISLSLNESCELAEHTHQEIVDQAVQYILELIESPRFQTKAAENRLNE